MMKAQRLHTPSAVEQHPLKLEDVAIPEPQADELLVRVMVCGVCHTDLHVIEGELPNPLHPLIPGHEVVGRVEKCGSTASRFPVDSRVGIPWLHETCGKCAYCKGGQENLCDAARFTGYTAQGGYAEYIVVREDFAVSIPEIFSDAEAAPLLCAGIVGYRSLRLSDLQPGEKLGLFGFGGSALFCLQVARYWNCEVYVFTRSPAHQQQALELGAVWAGQAQDTLPTELDRAILFAPAGWLVPLALGHLRKGGTLCINAIHTSPIPEMPYHLLWHERTIRTVANATRRDAEDFLSLAAQIPLHPVYQLFDLAEANDALRLLKHSEINGSAVLQIAATI